MESGGEEREECVKRKSRVGAWGKEILHRVHQRSWKERKYLGNSCLPVDIQVSTNSFSPTSVWTGGSLSLGPRLNRTSHFVL